MKSFILETQRTILRPFKSKDADAVFTSYASDAEVSKFMTWPTHTNISQSIEFIESCKANWVTGEEQTWGIVLKESDICIGCISVRMTRPNAEIGYVMARNHWNKGIMTEVAKAALDWAISQEGIVRVWASCALENAGSQRVLEKIDMQQERILRKWLVQPNYSSEAQDCYVYSYIEA